MRVAVSALALVAMASVIGTIIPQRQSSTDYLRQFGPYWFERFDALCLYDVYSCGWFILLLAGLTLSTAVCLIRNGPAYWRGMYQYRERMTLEALTQLTHFEKIEASSADERQSQWLRSYLVEQRFRFRQCTHVAAPRYTILAAKAGSAQRFGYLSLHAAIVLICLSALIDGRFFLSLRMWYAGKTLETRDLPLHDIPTRSWLSLANPSFRAFVELPEGGRSNVAFINEQQGYWVQPLPFMMELKKFNVEHYPTGQPKRFSSELLITDRRTQRKTVGITEVNRPLSIDGITIYQSGFGDGGSPLTFAYWPLRTSNPSARTMQMRSKSHYPLQIGAASYQLELGDFRLFNIENFSVKETAISPGTTSALFQRLLADSTRVKAPIRWRDVGPAIQYKLRDASGQAREYFNYMRPIRLDEAYYLVSGTRKQSTEPFQYFRVPIDQRRTIEPWVKLVTLFNDPEQRQPLALAVVDRVLPVGGVSEALRRPLIETTVQLLAVFSQQGLEGVEQQIRQNVNETKRQEVANVHLKLLKAAARIGYERQATTAPAPALDERFVVDSLLAMAALPLYGPPAFLQLTGFQQVQASGLQLTRSPTQTIVFLGSALLIIGTFLLFYCRERRLWLVCFKDEIWLAMSGSSPSSRLTQEFKRHCSAIRQHCTVRAL